MSCQALWQPEGWPCRGTSGTSQEGPCAPEAEAAAAQGLLPAAPRCCALAKGAACTQPSKGTVQLGSARRIPSRCVCFGALPSFALPHLFHTGAGPLIISGYWISGVTFNGFGC